MPSNAVRTTIKLDGDFDEFVSGNGQNEFIQNLALSLGVDYSQITIKNVYSGSIVIIYDLTPAAGQTREELRAEQNEAYSQGAVNLGADITDIETIDSDNDIAIVIMENGVQAEVVNGLTKSEYLLTLSIDDYMYYLCSKAKISMNFRDLF